MPHTRTVAHVFWFSGLAVACLGDYSLIFAQATLPIVAFMWAGALTGSRLLVRWSPVLLSAWTWATLANAPSFVDVLMRLHTEKPATGLNLYAKSLLIAVGEERIGLQLIVGALSAGWVAVVLGLSAIECHRRNPNLNR